MELLAVIRKDLTQSFRSLFALAFMFMVPILVTLLFYFIFGGIGDSEDPYALPPTRVLIVNLDQGQIFSDTNALPDNADQGMPGIDMAGVTSMGDLLTRVLLSDNFESLFNASETGDPAAARQAVDEQEAGVAIIIPDDFSASLMEEGVFTEVEFYQDPTLTIGPAIVESILSSMLDGFMASKITVGVTIGQMGAAGVPLTSELIQEIVNEAAASTRMDISGSGDTLTVKEVAAREDTDMITSILGLVMSGMSIFFLFFTGAASMQTILTEEEKGTLPRLFTTPTPRTTILSGKAIAVLVLLIVQIIVLLLFGRLMFGIYWGEPLQITLTATFIVLTAAGVGLFLVSWMENSRQAGVIFGGVLTITGMLGMITVFTGGAEVPPALEKATLLVPQGWAVSAFQTSMEGGSLSELLPLLAGMAAWTVVLGSLGIFRLRRRYA